MNMALPQEQYIREMTLTEKTPENYGLCRLGKSE